MMADMHWSQINDAALAIMEARRGRVATVDNSWLMKRVRNPKTGRMVYVKSLPPEEREKYRHHQSSHVDPGEVPKKSAPKEKVDISAPRQEVNREHHDKESGNHYIEFLKAAKDGDDEKAMYHGSHAAMHKVLSSGWPQGEADKIAHAMKDKSSDWSKMIARSAEEVRAGKAGF